MYKVSKISAKTFCNIAHQSILLKSIFRHGLTVALFLHYSCVFWRVRHNIGQLINTVFICRLPKKNESLFRHYLSSCKKRDRQNHTAINKLIKMFPPVAYNKTEICFADFFDPLILLRLHFIIIILFQTTFLQQTKASGGLDINSPYRMGHGKLVGCSDERRQIKFAHALHRDSGDRLNFTPPPRAINNDRSISNGINYE